MDSRIVLCFGHPFVEETRGIYQIEFMRCGVHCLGREF